MFYEVCWGMLGKYPVLLLLQVKRETLQATKYVELLLVADYAEVRNGIMFIPTEHWAQSEYLTCSTSWCVEGGWISTGSLLLSQCPTPTSRQGELCLGHFFS